MLSAAKNRLVLIVYVLYHMRISYHTRTVHTIRVWYVPYAYIMKFCTVRVWYVLYAYGCTIRVRYVPSMHRIAIAI